MKARRRVAGPAVELCVKALEGRGSLRGAARRHGSVARGEPEYREAAERHAGSVQANTTLLSPPRLWKTPKPQEGSDHPRAARSRGDLTVVTGQQRATGRLQGRMAGTQLR